MELENREELHSNPIMSPYLDAATTFRWPLLWVSWAPRYIRGLNGYQYRLEVYQKHMSLQSYCEPGAMILVILGAPAVLGRSFGLASKRGLEI